MTRELAHLAQALLITLRDMGCLIKSSQRKIEAAHTCNSHHFTCSESPDFTVRVIRDNHSLDEALAEMQSCFGKLSEHCAELDEKFLNLGEAMRAIGEVPA